MASFNRFDVFTTDLARGTHGDSFDADADTDTWKVYLSNAAPNAATHTVKATGPAEISMTNEANHGAGGGDVTNANTTTSGQMAVAGTDVVFLASGGTVGPFQYVILYNDTPTTDTPVAGGGIDPLIGWWDYGSAVTLQDGESFTVDFGANILTVG